MSRLRAQNKFNLDEAAIEKVLSGKGFHGRKFPFRPRSREDRPRIDAAVSCLLTSVDDMLYGLVRQHMVDKTDRDTIEEIVQQTRIHLWQKSLPKYNARRIPHVKPASFIHHCANNFIRTQLRSLGRKRSVQIILEGELDKYNDTVMWTGFISAMSALNEAPDQSLDRKIEAIANDVITNPKKYLTPGQANVLKALLRNPTALRKKLSEDLNYSRPSSLSMMLGRIKERIAAIDIDSYEPPKRPQGHTRSASADT